MTNKATPLENQTKSLSCPAVECSHPIGHICRRTDFVADGHVICRDRLGSPLLASCARAILQPTLEPPPYARVVRLVSGAVADAELRCRSARMEE